MDKWYLQSIIWLVDCEPSFALPVFARSRHNELYSQEIDDEDRVAGFSFVELEDTISEYVPEEERREVGIGDPAIWAFLVSRSQKLVGTRDELRLPLAEMLERANWGAFTRLEVAEFLESEDAYNAALRAAYSSMKDLSEETARSWLIREAIEPALTKILKRDLRGAASQYTWHFRSIDDSVYLVTNTGLEEEIVSAIVRRFEDCRRQINNIIEGDPLSEVKIGLPTELKEAAPKWEYGEELVAPQLGIGRGATQIEEQELGDPVEGLRLWLEEAKTPGDSWASSWKYLWRRRHSKDPRLSELALMWLRSADLRCRQWPALLQSVWATISSNSEYVDLAQQWLRSESKELPEWSHVWERLLDKEREREALLSLGRSWLEGREDRFEWNYVWERLLDEKHDREALLRLGRAWLEGREDRPAWSYVWERLLTEKYDREALLPLGLGWLQGREDQPGWSHVWERLLDDKYDSEALLPLGRAWLQGREDRPEWNYVWQRLLDEDYDREALISLGEEWLTSHEDDHGFPFVYRRIHGPKPSQS